MSSSKLSLSYLENPQTSPDPDFVEMDRQRSHHTLSTTDDTTTAVQMWDGGSSSLQPAELLNHNAKTGQFSLQNVLSTENSPVEQGMKDAENPVSVENEVYGNDDPIRCNILNFPVALGLFDRRVIIPCRLPQC